MLEKNGRKETGVYGVGGRNSYDAYLAFKIGMMSENTNQVDNLIFEKAQILAADYDQNGRVNSINDFSFKNKIKGKIGTFQFKERKVIQELSIYKTDKNKFTKF